MATGVRYTSIGILVPVAVGVQFPVATSLDLVVQIELPFVTTQVDFPWDSWPGVAIGALHPKERTLMIRDFA